MVLKGPSTARCGAIFSFCPFLLPYSCGCWFLSGIMITSWGIGTGPEVQKLVFMLKSAEHEICPANKSQNTNNCEYFLAKHI